MPVPYLYIVFIFLLSDSIQVWPLEKPQYKIQNVLYLALLNLFCFNSQVFCTDGSNMQEVSDLSLS